MSVLIISYFILWGFIYYSIKKNDKFDAGCYWFSFCLAPVLLLFLLPSLIKEAYYECKFYLHVKYKRYKELKEFQKMFK